MTNFRGETAGVGSGAPARPVAGNRTVIDRSTILLVAGGNISAMLFDDAVADAQSQAGAFAHALGGVEGIENTVRLFDAGTGVLKFAYHVAVLGEDADLQRAALARLPAWHPRHC